MRPRDPLLLIAALFFLAAPPAFGADADTITTFHTHDLHAQFLPPPATWRDDRAPIGGFEALEQTLRRERESAGSSIYLDAGDFMTGTPLSDLEHRGAEGGDQVPSVSARTRGSHLFTYSSIKRSKASSTAGPKGTPITAMAVARSDWAPR